MKTTIKLRISSRFSRPLCSVMLGLWGLAAWPGTLPAATVTLQQGLNGYTQAADAWLDESLKQRNYGGDPSLRVQYNSGMSDCIVIRFALPSLAYQSLAEAALGLYYWTADSMQSDNALGITPYRICSGMDWFENVFNGVNGYGVNWKYRDHAQTLAWTAQYGAWYDKIDDGNPQQKIKRSGGSVPDAIEPLNWVVWDVRHSVAHWHGGQENNGFVLYESSFEGGGTIAAGMFRAREHHIPELRPYLRLTYTGAQINWGGFGNASWDHHTANWNVGGYPGTFGRGDLVAFLDAAANPTIVIAGDGVSPGSMIVSNTATTYSFFGGGIGGDGDLTKQGSGLVKLSTANTYAGGTRVRAGWLIVTANHALGSTVGGTVVSPGAALGFESVHYSAAEPLSIAGTGSNGSGALYAASGDNYFAGPITLAGDSTIGIANTCGLALTSVIGGSFNLTKTGAGTLTFGGDSANIYAGDTYVNEGTLVLAKADNITAVPGDLFIGDGTTAATVRLLSPHQLASTGNIFVRKAGLLDLNGHDDALASLTLIGGQVQSGQGTLRIAGSLSSSGRQPAEIFGQLVLDGNPDISVVEEGPLRIFAGTRGHGFVKRGAGMLTLNQSNSFSGETVIAQGTVQVNNDPAEGAGLGPGPVRIRRDGILGGTGSISGEVTVESGGEVAPGTGVGTLTIENTLHFEPGSLLQLDVGAAVMPIDVLDLKQQGTLEIEDNVRLQLRGKLRPGAAPHVFVRGARLVEGTFQEFPQHGPVPGQPDWFTHYGTHRVYFSQARQPLVYFRAFSTNGVGLLMWRTAEEIETRSFDLFQWDGANWLAVNDKPIPAKNPQGAVYLVVNPHAYGHESCRFRLVANTPDGEEASEYDRTITEFAFSTTPCLVEGGVELRWFSRVDETYELWSAPDLNGSLTLLTNGLVATPPECVFTNVTGAPQGFYRLRLTP